MLCTATPNGGREVHSMKTRIIQTKYWKDSVVHGLSPDARFLFIYLLTCEQINICGVFELPDDYIQIDTGLTQGQLEKAKKELQVTGRCRFKSGWIKVVNAEKHNNYRNAPANQKAYERELSFIPRDLLDSLDSTVDTSIDSSVHTTYKSEIRNNKPKTIKQKTEFVDNFEEFWSEYPRKVGKQKAQELYSRLQKNGVVHESIMRGLRSQLPDMKKKEVQYIPHPATWLNQGRWEDEPEKPRRADVTENVGLKRMNIEDYKESFEKLGYTVDL